MKEVKEQLKGRMKKRSTLMDNMNLGIQELPIINSFVLRLNQKEQILVDLLLQNVY